MSTEPQMETEQGSVPDDTPRFKVSPEDQAAFNNFAAYLRRRERENGRKAAELEFGGTLTRISGELASVRQEREKLQSQLSEISGRLGAETKARSEIAERLEVESKARSEIQSAFDSHRIGSAIAAAGFVDDPVAGSYLRNELKARIVDGRTVVSLDGQEVPLADAVPTLKQSHPQLFKFPGAGGAAL